MGHKDFCNKSLRGFYAVKPSLGRKCRIAQGKLNFRTHAAWALSENWQDPVLGVTASGPWT